MYMNYLRVGVGGFCWKPEDINRRASDEDINGVILLMYSEKQGIVLVVVAIYGAQT